MISEDINPAAKRLKRHTEEPLAISSLSHIDSDGKKRVINGNSEARDAAAGIEKPKPDTQDILAKACSVIGLGSSMIELAESPNRSEQREHIKENNVYPVAGYLDKRNDSCFANGYRNYPQHYYTDSSSFYNNGCKEKTYAWNKYSPKNSHTSSAPGRMHQPYTYPKYQYAWHSLNKPEAQNQIAKSQYYSNSPCIPIRQPCRLSYNNNLNGVYQNGVHNNYATSEGRKYPYQYSYHRNNIGQPTQPLNSCRFPEPNYVNSKNDYMVRNNVPQSEVNSQTNRNYYGNGVSREQSNDVVINKKIPSFEHFYKVDPSKNAQISQYTPISSPISPYNPIINQTNGIVIENYDHLPDSQNVRNGYISIPNKPVNSQKECRTFFPADFYPPSTYREDNNNHARQTNRRHSYPTGYNTNGINHQNFPRSLNNKQFYSPDGSQLNFSNPNSYNIYDYNTMQSEIIPDNVRHKEFIPCNNNNVCKNSNNFSYQVNTECKITPLDYSLYGTDEIIKNSVKTPKTNLPHSPNIELIPLEGTSIISNISDVSNKTLPEISINTIPLTENESWHQSDSYSSNRINNVNSIGLHNSNDVASRYSVNNDGFCIDNQQEGKQPSNWFGKESPQYAVIPELTSIANDGGTQNGEYSQLGVTNQIEVEPSLKGGQYISDNNIIMSQPLKINKIINKNFIGAHSKQRPSSEPILQQRWPSFEMKRPLSVPVNSNEIYCESSLNLLPEDEIKIINFQHKLRPVLEHLLSIPEASSLLTLKENPRELLKHLVKLWGGDTSLSSSKVPLINIKENFLMLVKLLFKATLLLEWGWQNATADRILDDLVTPSNDGYIKYRISLEMLNLACPPVQDSCVGVRLDKDEFSSISAICCSELSYD